MLLKNKDSRGYTVIGLMMLLLILAFGLIANAALMQTYIFQKVSLKKQTLATPVSTGDVDQGNNRKVKIELELHESAGSSAALPAKPTST